LSIIFFFSPTASPKRAATLIFFQNFHFFEKPTRFPPFGRFAFAPRFVEKTKKTEKSKKSRRKRQIALLKFGAVAYNTDRRARVSSTPTALSI